MSTGTSNSGFSQGTKKRVINCFDRLDLEELLALDEPWTVRDCGRDPVQAAADLHTLTALEVVETVGEQKVRWEGQTQCETIKRYRFDPRARQLLTEYQEGRNELPCGHQAHIHHRADGQLGCRYCSDDQSFNRTEVKQAMGRNPNGN